MAERNPFEPRTEEKRQEELRQFDKNIRSWRVAEGVKPKPPRRERGS